MKKSIYSIRKLWILIILIGVIQSCSTSKKLPPVLIDTDCPPVMDYIISDFIPLDSLLADTSLTSTYSTKTIIVANAYGLTNDIRELRTLKNTETELKSNDSLRLATIEKAREIDKKLDLATLEIQTLQTYLRCINQKLIRAKTDLAATNNKSRDAYTNSAVIVGVASSALVAGAVLSDGELNEGSFKDWVGIAGGLVAAGLAVVSGRINKKVSLSHSNNAIAAIWNGENDQGVFTDNTWYLLNQPYLAYPIEFSMRDQILAIWNASESMLKEEDNMESLPVLLSNEGVYTEDMIQLRMNMLEELKLNIEEISRLLSMVTFEVQ
jgi:hypothetical protein